MAKIPKKDSNNPHRGRRRGKPQDVTVEAPPLADSTLGGNEQDRLNNTAAPETLPENDVRAEAERQARLDQAKIDQWEAEQAGVSIGEYRDQAAEQGQGQRDMTPRERREAAEQRKEEREAQREEDQKNAEQANMTAGDYKRMQERKAQAEQPAEPQEPQEQQAAVETPEEAGSPKQMLELLAVIAAGIDRLVQIAEDRKEDEGVVHG